MAAERTNGLTYAEAGVDIDAGNAMVEAIKPLVRATRRPGADAEIGGFGGLFDLKAAGFRDPVLVAANDGVGTKVKIAIEAGIHDSIGVDLVAMCLIQRARYAAAEIMVKAATSTMPAPCSAGASRMKALAPSTRAAKAIWAPVFSLLTNIGLMATGRCISQDTRMAEMIMRSRETTTMASQPGSTPVTDRVT